MKRTIERITRTAMLAVAFMLCATTSAWAAAPTPVAEWSGDLENGSVKNTKYTMSADSTVVSFSNGSASLSSSKDVASTGVKIDWPNPTTDDASFTSRKMSVILQYSGLSILDGNTSLLSALWGGTSKEYMVRTTSNNGTAAIATDITGASSAGTQLAPSSNFPAPAQGKLLVCFSGDSSHRPGIDLYFSRYDSATATYGDYQRVSYWSEQKVDNGMFYGLKIGGTIAGTGKYYRPAMTVEGVEIYDDIVVSSVASVSGDTVWSGLVWNHDVFDVVPASLYTYIINVSESATLDLSNATIPTAEKVLINVAADKTLTLTGTPTSSGAPIEIAGSGKVVLSSDPGCSIVVASGGTLDISASTVSSAITNNGTVNANGCAFTGAVSNSGTLNTSGTVSFSSSARNSSSGTFNVLSGTTTYNSSSQKGISGTLNIAKNATLINGKQDSILWDGTVHVYISGIVTMNAKWTIGANNYIHLYDGALVNGSAGNAFHFNSGEGKIIAETGSSTITAPFVKGGGTISIETKSGATLALPNHSNPAFAKSGAGTVRIRNARIPAITGSEGTVELYSDENYDSTYHAHTITGVAFSGTVRVETSGSSYQVFLWSDAATAGMFANRPILDASGQIWLYNKIADYPVQVRNLTGNGLFRLNATRTEYRYVDTMQTADSTFSGSFITVADHESGDVALTVRGAENAPAIYSLTLSGANTTTGPLAIENNAKVVFASTGSWAGGTVTVKNGGVLESQNSESIADRLVVQEGATLKFANGVPLAATAYDWSAVTNDEAVKLDLSSLTPSATPATLIASGVTVEAGKFKVTSAPCPVDISVVDGALKVAFSNYWSDGAWIDTPVSNKDATLRISQNSTLTVSEALSLGAVTVVKEGEDDVTLTISGAGALTTGGWTIPAGVTVKTPTTMTISGAVSGDGVINVPANTTLAMNGVTCSTKVTVAGTLETRGTTTLSAANTSAAGSLIEVVSDVTTLSTKYEGISGDIKIDAPGELKFAASWTGSVDQMWDYLAPDGSTCIKVYGKLTLPNVNIWMWTNTSIELYDKAVIEGSGDNATTYGSLMFPYNSAVNVYGNATINAPISTRTSCSPTFTIAEGKTLTLSNDFIAQTAHPASAYECGGSLTKAGAGTLDLTAITPTKPITINAGTVVADEMPTTTITINENGTFTLKDCAWTGNSNVFVGTGTLYLNYTKTTNDKVDHSVTGSTFSGTLKVGVLSNKAAYFNQNPALQLTGNPTLRLECGTQESPGSFYLGNSAIGRTLSAKNLSGWGIMTPWFGVNGTATFNIEQTDDTEFFGTFIDWQGTSKKLGLTVSGGSTVKSLTLSGENTTSGPLAIQNNAKVVFSGSGSWLNGTTTVKSGGVLESQRDAQVIGALALEAGSTLAYGNSSEAIKASGALTLPASGKVAVDVSDLTIGAGDSTTLLTVGSGMPANVNKFALDSNTHVLSVSGQTLSLVPIAATLTKNDDTVVPFATVQEAVNATINPLYDGYKYITVNVDDTTVNAVGTTLKVKYGAGVSSFTVNSPSAEYEADGGVMDSESGITTYSITLAATTYTWAATGEGVKKWTTPANWTYGSGTPAIRCPTTCDSVVFKDGANVTLDSTMTVAGIAVNGAVSISGSAKSLNTSGNITGEGTLTLSDICLASVGAELTVAPNINFTNDSELARVTSGKLILNGDITARGTFKVWDVTHTVNGNLSIASGVNMAIGSGLEVKGTTTFNGDFEKTGNGTLSLGAVNVVGNSAPTVTTGSIAIGGAITVGDGVTFTRGSITLASGYSFNGGGTATIVLPAPATPVQYTLANNWAGTIELPSYSLGAEKFNNYGNSNSKVRINGYSGWLNWTQTGNPNNKSRHNPTLDIAGSFAITAMSQYDYTFDKVTGSGSMTFPSGAPNSITITELEVPEGFNGVCVTNNTSKALTIGTLTLPSLPTCDQKILSVGGTGSISLDISNIKVGESPLPAKYKLERRHVGEEGDGFYVYYNGTIFSVW